MSYIQFERGAISAGDCVGNAWNLVTNKFWLYIGIGVLTMILIGCIPLVNLFLVGPVMAGFYYVVLRDMRGEPIDFGMMFKGFEKFLPLMIVGLIQAIPGIIFQVIRFTVDIAQLAGAGSGRGSGTFYQTSGFDPRMLQGLSAVFIMIAIGFSLFSIVWHIALQFAIPLVLEHDLSVGDAIKTSVSAALGNLGGMIVMLILGGLIGVLGFLALCFGLLVAVPVVYAANVFAYRQVFPMLNKNFNLTPPPPTAYGTNFGSGV